MKQDRFRKEKKVLLLMILVLVILLAVLFFLTSCRLEHIELVDSTKYTESDMKYFLKNDYMDRFTPWVYFKNKHSGAPEIPFVDKLEFEMVDMNTIRIRVYEKKLVGCVYKDYKYMYFDRDGVVIEDSDEYSGNVPIVRGLQFEDCELNEKIETGRNTLFDDILEISQLVEKNSIEAKEIIFTDNAEVELVCPPCVVELGKRDSYDYQLNNLPAVLKSVEGKSMRIDMRFFSENDTTITAKEIEEDG